VPSLFKGLRLSKLFGRRGVISFESNGALVLTRGGGLPRLTCPGLRDMRGYQAMYRDFAAAIASGKPPEMSLERAAADHHLMADVYKSLARSGPAGRAAAPAVG
jgi:predicted dehydrogenase